MIYRLVTVWRDDESEQHPITRAMCDFPSEDAAEACVSAAVAAGVTRLEVRADPMEDGTNLKAVLVPVGRIIGWYIWELPDDAPAWGISNA